MIIKSIYNTFLDALFPISAAEQEIISMHPEDAWKALPRARNFSTREAGSIFAYKDERVRKLIWRLKYKKSRPAAAICGQALYRIIRGYADVIGPIIILPMPVSKQRRRERGFNQCELLTDEIQRLDAGKAATVIDDLLIRAHHSSRQTLKNRTERLENAREIFSVDARALQRMHEKYGKEECEDLFILVIDDVVTTGSTVAEALTALREAGFTRAYGLSVAH